MVMQKKVQEPKDVQRARIIIRKYNRTQLEINASHVVLFKQFKEKLYTLPFVKINHLQTEVRSSFFFNTDEDLRKMIFEHEFPGYVWRK